MNFRLLESELGVFYYFARFELNSAGNINIISQFVLSVQIGG